MVNHLAKRQNFDRNKREVIRIQSKTVHEAFQEAKETCGPDFFIVDISEHDEFVEVFVSTEEDIFCEHKRETKGELIKNEDVFAPSLRFSERKNDAKVLDHELFEKDSLPERSFLLAKGGLQSLLTFKHSVDAIRFITRFSKAHLLSESFCELWIQKTMLNGAKESVFQVLRSLEDLFFASSFENFINNHVLKTENRLIIFLGSSGSGKTVLVAKCVAYLLAMGLSTRVVTVDTSKAGSVAQLKFYLDELHVPLFIGEEQLKRVLCSKDQTSKGASITICDTSSFRPYDNETLDYWIKFENQFNGSFLFVYNNDIHPEEGRERVKNAYMLGAHHMIVSKLDSVKGAGSWVQAAAFCKMSVLGGTNGPSMGDLIVPLSAFDFLKKGRFQSFI